MKKLIALLLAVVMVFGMVACGNDDTTDEVATYTYHSYASSLGTNWNPHTWEMSGDSDIMSYIETPLADMSILNSETGEYQWIFLAASNIEDVTAEYQDDLVKYGSELGGKDASEITEGYVYKISLNPEMKWQNGTPINADTYIYSMQQLLAPEMKNYRANNYYDSDSALAGAYDYFYSDVENLTVNLESLGYADADTAVGEGKTVYLDMWNFWGLEGCLDADGNECPQYVDITDTTLYRDAAVAEGEDGDWISAADIFNMYNPGGYFTAGNYLNMLATDVANEAYGASWDTVGLYKEDDYTIIYVCENYYSYYYFLTSCTSNWLVYEELYEAGKETTGTLVSTDYNTSAENTMAYGPFMIESLQDGKQIVFARNPYYFEYEYDEDGNYLGSTSSFLVDGENVEQWVTDKVVIDVMTDDAAKQAFMKGELDTWTPAADEVVNYSTSEQLYQVDETYTQRLFFNCDLDSLKSMDANFGNVNSVVLSNDNFRKAFSLAIDRDNFVTATAGYKAASYLLNSLYFYDVYEDPSSVYRNSDEAMQAICNLYGVEYGEGTIYPTLKDAYDSITGYNLTEATLLMETALDELVADGLYTAGDPITIRLGWKKGALDSTDNQQIALLEQYINAAAEPAGFGHITFEGVDNLENRYLSVAQGEFAIGWGAWGGAAFYPFTIMRCYCDPDYVGGVESIHESGCWDPTTTKLTLTIDGEEVTMTWTEWSNSCTGTGKYAAASNETKLQVLAGMEENWLEFYYAIPMCTTTSCYLLSYKLQYYTEDYNIMYGFGGTRLLKYNYNDAEWTAFVAEQGGTLSYE